MVMLFDTETQGLIGRIQLDHGVSALSFSPDGARLAAGMDEGGGVILMYKERAGLVATSYTWGAALTGPIAVLKYAPNGGLIAQGRQNKIEALKNKVGTCIGHAGEVKHLDWSSDAKLLATSSDAYELLFWDAQTCTPVLASSVASFFDRTFLPKCTCTPVLASSVASLFDRTLLPNWASWSCNLGWPVQGVVESSQGVVDSSQNEMQVVTVCSRVTEDEEPLLVTGEDDGSVRLFRYPAVSSAMPPASIRCHVRSPGPQHLPVPPRTRAASSRLGAR
ncbi:hypothetical protein T484DRAFT_1902397 [Baffinella frigidus]|nr:hypothetical protein T484DRAFT_1902397 [Cryptophyta sp. CCMP2293]